jgi:hypothetical protein
MNSNARVKAAVAANRRITILRLLDDAGCPCNSAVIETSTRDFRVPGVTRAAINEDARWLAAAGLLTVEELRPDLLGMNITARGERVARGEERVEGVARPSED